MRNRTTIFTEQNRTEQNRTEQNRTEQNSSVLFAVPCGVGRKAQGTEYFDSG